jgi:hypothetical protein
MSTALRRIAGLATALAATAALAASAPAASLAGELEATYEMNCSFTLTKDGRPLGTLEPGEYTVVVTTPVPFANPDQQPGIVYLPICDGAARFSLTGPGVNLHSTVGDGNQVRAQYTVTLQPNATYTAADDKGPGLGRAVFSTSAATQDATPAPTATTGTGTRTGGAGPSPSPEKLDVSATPKGAVRLVLGGKPVVRVHPGVYTLVLVDRSPKAGYVLRGPGGKVVHVTTARFTGRASKRVQLTAGRWLLLLGTAKASTLTVA